MIEKATMNANIHQEDASSAADRELVVSRVVRAPAALVFNAWIEPAQFEQWWGPPDYETRVHEMVVEPDGKTRFVMVDQDGFEYPTTLVYAGIEAARSLSYMQTDGSDPDDDAATFGVAVRFEDEGQEATRVTMSILFKTAAVRDRAAAESNTGAGAGETLRRLDQFLQDFLPQG
jgi:uncharacterized protein YndB with AHSA1/START domain